MLPFPVWPPEMRPLAPGRRPTRASATLVMGAALSSNPDTTEIVCPRRRLCVGAPVPVTTISSRLRATVSSPKFVSTICSAPTVTCTVWVPYPIEATERL